MSGEQAATPSARTMAMTTAPAVSRAAFSFGRVVGRSGDSGVWLGGVPMLWLVMLHCRSGQPCEAWCGRPDRSGRKQQFERDIGAVRDKVSGRTPPDEWCWGG